MTFMSIGFKGETLAESKLNGQTKGFNAKQLLSTKGGRQLAEVKGDEAPDWTSAWASSYVCKTD